MDSFEWNKIFGAVLGTVLVIVALNIGISMLMKPHHNEKPGMEVAVAETPAGGPVEVEQKPDWGTVLPVADVAAGEKIHQRCLQCHDFTKGGPNKIGPNLWGIVGNRHGQAAGFSYSAGMAALADKSWDYDALDAFIKNPKAAVTGTKMAFAGLSKQNDRINLIAFLRQQSDAPLAIPAPNPAAPAPATPGDGATEPAGEVQAPPPGTAPATPEGAAPATPAAPGATAPATPPAAAPATTPAPATPAPAAPGH